MEDSQSQFDDVNSGGGGGGAGGAGSGGSMGGGSGSGSSSGGSSSNGGSVSSATLKIPCLGDNNEVVNAAPADVCKSVLPKCAELRKTLEDEVKDMMSQKIYGYYLGKDIDLTKSTPGNPVGKDTKWAICSVVGQNLDGSSNGVEVTSQSIGKKASCGTPPRVDAHGRDFKLVYDGMNGGQWISYMRGAYPFIIRKHTKQTFDTLKTDMSNVQDVLSGGAMSADLAQINEQMKRFAQSLSGEAHAACDKPNSNLLADCASGHLSVNDPAYRACTLANSVAIANKTALGYMIAYKIMEKVQEEYDRTFSKVATFDNPAFKRLADAASKTSGFLRSKDAKLAMTASAFFGGNWCSSSGQIQRSPASGKCREKDVRFGLQSGDPNLAFSFEDRSRQLGFAGMVEYLIVHEVCGMNRYSDASPCKYDLPFKPKNAP